ncbi:MAG: amidohydrolase family protein [Cytophagales bacterium]|nr:amidohydrolase family protein [Cytophagales bacterium]
MKKILLSIIVTYLVHFNLISQETFPLNGVKDKRPEIYAFTNATIFVDYQTVLKNATLIIKDGIVESVGAKITIPKGYIVTDLKGKYIYPSFLDIYTGYGIPQLKKRKRSRNSKPQFLSNKKGAYHWNQAIKPEINAKDLFAADTGKAKQFRNLGFGAALTLQKDGVVRGSSVLVTLADANENDVMILDMAAAHYSFDKGSSTQNYPGSLMGTIALLRQTWLDARWYKQRSKSNAEYNISLEAFNNLQSLPQIFDIGAKLAPPLQVLRANKIGDEFGVQYIMVGSGLEYQRINDIKATRASFIIPLNFPLAYKVEDPLDATKITLSEMKHWELAPANPSKLAEHQIQFAITTAGLKNKKDFWKNLRKAIEYGLDEKVALKALTYTPAKLLRVDDQLGSLKKGKIANFLITASNIFDKENIIYQNWVQGKKYEINDIELTDIRGTYDLTINEKPPLKLKITGKLQKPELNIHINDTTKIKINFSRSKDQITLYFDVGRNGIPADIKQIKNGDSKGNIRLSGWIEGDILSGKGQLPDGSWIKWDARQTESFKEEHTPAPSQEGNKKDTIAGQGANDREPGAVIYPFTAYGWEKKPKQETVLFKNATVWTNERDGILENTDVLIQNGKISKIGRSLTPQNARVIDATGKHLTSGIIDEHSHIAIYKGVNEGTQAVSAEVRIGDVINSEDVNIYRQLAGGVTAVQLLHGSANPIGGQSALIKLRWGALPSAMKIKDADGFIKFALGENVKQSNWGNNRKSRFPQTRMGVEQVYFDAFTRAKEYKQATKKYNSLSGKEKARTMPPRKDLELEALSEILDSKRFITCHSYRQSEINMLMKVADSMGFRVNTFTHILEGYKVADKMKAHGAGASTFSDWWAYKYEVIEAVPYNGALMHQVGIVTAYNSDDAEMGRRLNQEAAKAVKYGGLSEEEAWKFVTLNPAKLLHLDNNMGSIKAGKDADLVIWSDNPLSIYAKAEKTFVDGICYFDMEQDKRLRDEIKKERMRLIQKMLEKKKGENMQEAKKKREDIYRCGD